MASEKTKSSGDRFVYREFGQDSSPEALQRSSPQLPPEKQNLRIQTTRAGRKGKTVTVITGFQTSPEILQTLLKQLKTQCGTGGTLKGNEIEIQGDHKPKILEILTKLGYKAKISGG